MNEDKVTATANQDFSSKPKKKSGFWNKISHLSLQYLLYFYDY